MLRSVQLCNIFNLISIQSNCFVKGNSNIRLYYSCVDISTLISSFEWHNFSWMKWCPFIYDNHCGYVFHIYAISLNLMVVKRHQWKYSPDNILSAKTKQFIKVSLYYFCMFCVTNFTIQINGIDDRLIWTHLIIITRSKYCDIRYLSTQDIELLHISNVIVRNWMRS